jgi:hypothetical protein
MGWDPGTAPIKGEPGIISVSISIQRKYLEAFSFKEVFDDRM